MKMPNQASMDEFNIIDISLEVDLYGFCVIDGLYKENEFFYKIQESMENLSIDRSKSNLYKGGNLKIYDTKTKGNLDPGNPLFAFNEKLKKDFINLKNGFKGYRSEFIYETYDTKESIHIAQDPHFDRIPTLKFMLYINELKADNGAFWLSPASHNWVKDQFPKNIRPHHDNQSYLKKTRQIPDCIINRLIPIEGSEGTLIIFHTDCIHHQGSIKEGVSKIVRAHYRKRNNLRQSIQKRLVF